MDKLYKINESVCASKSNVGADSKEEVLFVVMLSSDEDDVYKIDGVAKEIFEKIEEKPQVYSKVVADIISQYDSEYEEQIQLQSEKFFNDLMKHKILVEES